MADGTFRPERRAIDPNENDPAANQERLAHMAAMRQEISNAPASPEAFSKTTGIKVAGNIPPQFAAALKNANREDEDIEHPVTYNSPSQKGPRTREHSEQPAPRSKPSTILTPSQQDANDQSLLKKLISGARQKSFQYEQIILPSLGKFYDGTNGPLDGKLHIRPMMGEEEQILSTPRFVKRGEAIDMIFSRCIEEDFNTEHFNTPDRNYLLIYLRGISYSPNYDVSVKCPNCDKRFNTTIDLNTLWVERCPDDYGIDDLVDTLPTTGYKFRYRLSTGADDQQVQAYRDQKAKGNYSNQFDDTLLHRTATMIEDIEGVTDTSDIKKLLKALPINDVSYLRNVINEPPFGVDTNVEINCPSCSSEFEIELPLESSFFFPRGKKKKKKDTTQV